MTSPAPLRVLAAPDKFRGTLTGGEAAAAICRGAAEAGLASAVTTSCERLPLADGGEGTVEALGGANRTTTVTGPLGRPVDAQWRMHGARAVIEMAAASGLALTAGRNNPLVANTRGTGQLIAAAIEAGAREIIIGLGGSATTDGGVGVLSVLAPGAGHSLVPHEVKLIAAADVRTRFLDAAAVFGPQKGATPREVEMLTDRLGGLRDEYRRRFDIDVAAIDRTGAAGGLGGALAALGAELVDGFDAVARAVRLDDALDHSDLVITGEGHLDASSLHGKVVGGVIDRAGQRDLPVLILCGRTDPGVELPDHVTAVSLVEIFGEDAALADPAGCLTRATADFLAGGYAGPS